MANLAASSPIIIVGGGVIGCAIAYFLAADHGVHPIVIERHGIATHASGSAAGELSPISRTVSADPIIKFGIEGLLIHHQTSKALIKLSGIDYFLSDVPILRPAFTLLEAKALAQQQTVFASLGIKSSWLSNAELTDVNPWIRSESFGGLLIQETQLETRLFSNALARAAESTRDHDTRRQGRRRRVRPRLGRRRQPGDQRRQGRGRVSEEPCRP